MLCIIYISGEIGGSAMGALAGGLGRGGVGNDGMLFGMRFLPCMIVWPFMAQLCVCVCVRLALTVIMFIRGSV